MGEPLSSDRVFDFPVDEPEPHPAYDFFVPGPLPGYAGNPNNNNGWIKADVPLHGELKAMADEPMVGPLVDEIAEPIVEAEEQEVNEQWLMAPVTPPPMPAVPPPSVYDVGGPSTTAAEGQSFPFLARGLPIPPSMIKDLSTHLGDGVLDGLCRGQMGAGAGFIGSSAAERFTDSAAADYGFGDEKL
nr:hypothetical protein [Tanacetum cinerariifolium]